jgi:hypothetical protein
MSNFSSGSKIEQTSPPTENIIFGWTRRKICGDKRALRLAEALPDRQASQALAAHAATLVERAQSLEQGEQPVLSAEQPAPSGSSAEQLTAQQKQQIQPPNGSRTEPTAKTNAAAQ